MICKNACYLNLNNFKIKLNFKAHKRPCKQKSPKHFSLFVLLFIFSPIYKNIGSILSKKQRKASKTRLVKGIKIFMFSEEKKNSNNVATNNIKISLKMKNIGWLSREKISTNHGKIKPLQRSVFKTFLKWSGLTYSHKYRKSFFQAS